jgi:putative acetyltransferase
MSAVMERTALPSVSLLPVSTNGHKLPAMKLPDHAHLNLRTATNRDMAQVMALVASVLAEYKLQIDPQATDADLLDIEKNYLTAGGVFEVIEDEQGNLVGTVGLYPLDSATCELRKMYFAPSLRGLGLGHFILERAIERARSLGFAHITLETASVLKAANHLYAKYGFRPVAKAHLPARADLAYSLDLLQQ